MATPFGLSPRPRPRFERYRDATGALRGRVRAAEHVVKQRVGLRKPVLASEAPGHLVAVDPLDRHEYGSRACVRAPWPAGDRRALRDRIRDLHRLRAVPLGGGIG